MTFGSSYILASSSGALGIAGLSGRENSACNLGIHKTPEETEHSAKRISAPLRLAFQFFYI